jgi:uncharacterized protein involved in type VI secretion and phage assembly
MSKLTHGLLERHGEAKMDGIWVGIVTDNQDQDGRYMVKVKLPDLHNSMKGDHEQFQTDWCRIANLMGGDRQGGFYSLPAIGDEVLVAFFHGQLSHPVVLGAVWSDVAAGAKQNTDQEHPQHRPIYDDVHACGNDVCSAQETCGPVTQQNLQGFHKSKKNDLRVFRSRAGHQLIFNDNETEARVVVHTAKGHKLVMVDPKQGENRYLELSDHDGQSIKMDTKEGVIKITAREKILLEAKTLVHIEATGGNVETKSSELTKMGSKNFEITADQKGALKATSGNLTLNGQQVHLNCN